MVYVFLMYLAADGFFNSILPFSYISRTNFIDRLILKVWEDMGITERFFDFVAGKFAVLSRVFQIQLTKGFKDVYKRQSQWNGSAAWMAGMGWRTRNVELSRTDLSPEI